MSYLRILGINLVQCAFQCGGNDHKKWRHTVNSCVVLVNNGHDFFLHHLEHPGDIVTRLVLNEYYKARSTYQEL